MGRTFPFRVGGNGNGDYHRSGIMVDGCWKRRGRARSGLGTASWRAALRVSLVKS